MLHATFNEIIKISTQEKCWSMRVAFDRKYSMYIATLLVSDRNSVITLPRVIISLNVREEWPYYKIHSKLL